MYMFLKTYRFYMFQKKHIDSLKKHIEFTCLGKTYAWTLKKHIDSIVFFTHVYDPSSPV